MKKLKRFTMISQKDLVFADRKEEEMERLKLRARIIERYGTLGKFAEKCGTNYQTISNTLSGRITPRGMALIGWMAALGIPKDQAYIFFPESVENYTEEGA